MRGVVRLITAIAVIGMSGFSVVQGWMLFRFSVVMMSADSPDKRAGIVKTWGTTTGVASAALQNDLSDKIDVADQKAANRQREALAAILLVKPVSPQYWLALSGMQLITDQPMEDVLESLKMSTLTGPNEGSVMVDRGIYGVSLWLSLPPDLKSRVANDLLPVLFPRTPEDRKEAGKLHALVASEPQRVRKELHEALLSAGVSPADIEQKLGL